MIRRTLLAALLSSSRSVAAFTVPTPSTSSRPSSRIAALNDEGFEAEIEIGPYDPLGLADASSLPRAVDAPRRAAALAAAATSVLVSSPLAASAAGPDWGIFEGRIGSLLHPAAMLSMAAMSASTALLGFQWRRQRTIGDEISALKRTLPDLRGAGSVGEALRAAEGAEEVDASYVSGLRGAVSVQAEIDELTRERKELASAGPRDRHFNQGALLLFIGTAFAIEGPLNTYARAGKLFPGPHLYAGAGLVVCWALAASMVPAMQKGNDAARTVHIGANLAGLGLFAWQVTTGVPILLKVVELTKWP